MQHGVRQIFAPISFKAGITSSDLIIGAGKGNWRMRANNRTLETLSKLARGKPFERRTPFSRSISFLSGNLKDFFSPLKV